MLNSLAVHKSQQTYQTASYMGYNVPLHKNLRPAENDPTFHINEAARGRVIEIARKLNYNKANKKRGPKQPDSSLSVTLVMRSGNMREFNPPTF